MGCRRYDGIFPQNFDNLLSQQLKHGNSKHLKSIEYYERLFFKALI